MKDKEIDVCLISAIFYVRANNLLTPEVVSAIVNRGGASEIAAKWAHQWQKSEQAQSVLQVMTLPELARQLIALPPALTDWLNCEISARIFNS
jgi:hypothetical protein